MNRSIANILSTKAIWMMCCASALAQHQPFSGNQTLTYEACIAAYDSLDKASDIATLMDFGSTDCGRPLHLFIINKDKVFYPELFDRKKNVLLINNAIHPGEPDGVDACVMLCRELLLEKSELLPLLDSTIICIIPIYNVDGALNRNSHSRANQNGPEEYGFRGNARNLDLNRDFIKCDSRNARSFAQMFTRLMPEVMVDTHVSNGADYPYTMTLITTQCDKLGNEQGKFVKNEMEPALFDMMKNIGHAMCPYVNTMGRTPESGLIDFLETPRFATGYAALFGTIGFTTETHMLKSFDKRVESTYQFLVCLLQLMDAKANAIHNQKADAMNIWMKAGSMFLNHEADTSIRNTFVFNGYIAEEKPADVGTGMRLFYNHNAPWTQPVSYYRKYRGADSVAVPQAYIIPQAWDEAVQLMHCNHVKMERLEVDTSMIVTVYYIGTFDTAERPYEGHYLHSNTEVRSEQHLIKFFMGDYVVHTSQAAVRYIATALEPACDDSFFAWNFFDSVLQQKEWFSDYVFEDIARQLLDTDASLKAAFENELKENPSLKESHWNQLYWIYKHSDYYEPSAYRYPVFRVE
ncbi:MAG: M14 family zinc carboxypeptidase [Flavobacteriales bacterium]